MVAVGVFTALVALLPLLFNRQFYFFADTPDGAYGQWYELGQQIAGGNWPLMNPAAWMAGNYVAEGQWGLWNPIILAIGLFVASASNAVVASTIIKVFFLVVGALGVYALTRTYGARRPWAVVAGIAAPFAGFTFFMDAPSWVTNMITWAFFAWAVAALRMWTTRGGLWILPAFAAIYLLVTVGYVQGTIMLVFFFVALLVEAAFRRSRERAVRTLLAGVPAALIAIGVYLPGVLTASVTARSTGIANDGFLVVNLTGLATSSVPSGQVDLMGWWGRYTDVPLLYVFWLLPLVVVVPWSRVRASWAEWSPLLIFGGLATALAVGPSMLGPLRFPARTMPWVALVIICIACLLLSRTDGRWVLRRGRLWALALVWAAPFWLAFSQVPLGWRRHLIFAALTGAALIAVVLLRRARPHARKRTVAIVAATSAAVVGLQSAVFADSLVSRAPYEDEASAYTQGMPTGYGEGMVIGSPLGMPDTVFDEVEFANMWYLTDRVNVLNLYTPVEYQAMAADLCLAYDGRTCPEAVDTLFETDPDTGATVADLLSLDSVQLIEDADTSVADLAAETPPAGWSQSFVGRHSVVWTRDRPTGDVGSVTWTSPGTDVEIIEDTPLSTTFRVTAVPSDGGRVALSRLAWPGYTVEGGELGAPVRGYLTSVDVPGGSTGTTITVRFAPPGWSLIVAGMIGSVLFTIVVAILAQRRRTRRPTAAA
jgi:hypothetical protein